MALVQAGMGLTRVVVLVGAGFAGSVVFGNGRLSVILGELKELLDKDAAGGGGGGRHGSSDQIDLAETVRRLSSEIREIASAKVSVVHVDSGNGSVSSLVAPAAAAGVLGYGYMRWKGISFSSLMYVTKQNMANAVTSMTKHLEQVQTSLAAAKRHLTQRIQHLDDKLDQQREISGQIRDEVTGARMRLQNIGSEMQKIKETACGLDGKLDSIEAKQNYSLAGVMYLVQFIEQNGGSLPNRPELMQRAVRRFGGVDQKQLEGLGLRVLALESASLGHPQSTRVNPAS